MNFNNRPRRGTILEVPYKEKDEVKQLGAWWDPEIRKWFVPQGKDVKPFQRWFSENNELNRGKRDA